MSVWQEYLEIQFDPAHLMADLGFTIVFDGLILALLVPVVKKITKRVLHQWHMKLDEEHGVEHTE